MNQDGTSLIASYVLYRPFAAPFDLNQSIEKLVHLRQYEHRHRNISVVLDMDKTLPKASANAEEIEAVLVALFARARNAIGQAKRPGGTITVRSLLNGRNIQFSVTDDGVPAASSEMDEGVCSTAFQDDINLTICAEIVQEQGGELYAWRPHHSATTTVVMDLPVAD